MHYYDMRSQLRRIVEIGGSYYISLPKGWIKQMGISKGSLIEIISTENGRLLLKPYSPHAKPTAKHIKISAGEGLERRIIMAYLGGFDIIEVYHSEELSSDHRKAIESISELLIGLEIVKENSKSIVLECLWLKPEDPWSFIKRMDLIAQSMYRDAIEALIVKDKEKAHTVIERDSKVDKLYFFVVRMIRSMLSNLQLILDRKLSPIKLLDYRLLARDIEEIADHAENIAHDVLKLLHIKFSSIDMHLLNKLVNKMATLESRILVAYEREDLTEAIKLTYEISELKRKILNLSGKLLSENKLKVLELSILNNLMRILDLQKDMIDLIA